MSFLGHFAGGNPSCNIWEAASNQTKIYNVIMHCTVLLVFIPASSDSLKDASILKCIVCPAVHKTVFSQYFQI